MIKRERVSIAQIGLATACLALLVGVLLKPLQRLVFTGCGVLACMLTNYVLVLALAAPIMGAVVLMLLVKKV